MVKRIFQKTYGYYRKLILPAGVFLFVFLMLTVVQIRFKVSPILLLERFIQGGGWFEIFVIAVYGSIVTWYMQVKANVLKWRRLTWIVFSVVFFLQLIIGLSGVEKFLMTGKLHLPIPVMILSGPLYRGQLSVMTLLFLSTIILTGPAWCSQLCYFGAFDNIAAGNKKRRHVIKHKTAIKSTILILIIAVTIIMRYFNVPMILATIVAVCFGIVGILIMVIVSRKKSKMVHCVLYCPIGTLVSVLKPLNPFRLQINSNCNQCMKCSVYCKYDALQLKDIQSKKPGFTCTLCGDCLVSCNDNAIQYKFLGLKPERARNLYLLLTISLHAIFLALARI